MTSNIRTSCKAHKHSRGFTLVELLVVVAIISLLVSMLLPALASARAVANRVKCGANMRGVAQALNIYVQDSDQFLPPQRYSDGSNSTRNLRTTLSGTTSTNLNEYWLAALVEGRDGATTYLNVPRSTFTSSSVQPLITGNMLYCPAALPEINTDSTSGGPVSGYGAGILGPARPTSDADPNAYRGVIYELEFATAIASGSSPGGFSTKIGVQSWYGAWSQTQNSNMATLWWNIPIRQIDGDDINTNPGETNGVKYTSIPSPADMPFLLEGPQINLQASIYRFSVRHGTNKTDMTSNIAFMDGHVDNFKRSDVLPAISSGTALDFTKSACQQVKATGVRWRMDQ